MLMHNFKATAAEILDVIQSSPHVKAALGEMDKDRAAARHKAAERLNELVAASGLELQLLVQRQSELYLQHLSDMDRIRATGAQMNATAAKRSDLAWRTERMRSNLEALLHETCSPCIQDFIEWTDNEIAATCRYAEREHPIVVRHVFTGEKQQLPRVTLSVAPVDRVAALRAARAVASELKLLADQGAVPEQLAELKNGIPSIGDKK